MSSECTSPVDTAWLHMDDPHNPADIVTLLTFDERLSYEALKRTVEQRLLKYARFKQRVSEVGGHLSWEDDPQFQIERHLTQQTLDTPLSGESLHELVAELANQRLKPGRPLWALHLIDGSEGGSAIVARLHHCIADGFALAHAMIDLADRANETPPSQAMKPAERSDHQPLLDVLVHEANEIARHPGHAWDWRSRARH